METEECRKDLVKSTNKGHVDVLMIKLFSDTILNRYLSWERIHVCISKSFVNCSFYCLDHVSWATLILQFSFLWYHCWMSHVYFCQFFRNWFADWEQKCRDFRGVHLAHWWGSFWIVNKNKVFLSFYLPGICYAWLVTIYGTFLIS